MPGEAEEPTSVQVFKSMPRVHLSKARLLKLQMDMCDSSKPSHFARSFPSSIPLWRKVHCGETRVCLAASTAQSPAAPVSQSQQHAKQVLYLQPSGNPSCMYLCSCADVSLLYWARASSWQPSLLLSCSTAACRFTHWCWGTEQHTQPRGASADHEWLCSTQSSAPQGALFWDKGKPALHMLAKHSFQWDAESAQCCH